MNKTSFVYMSPFIIDILFINIFAYTIIYMKETPKFDFIPSGKCECVCVY